MHEICTLLVIYIYIYVQMIFIKMFCSNNKIRQGHRLPVGLTNKLLLKSNMKNDDNTVCSAAGATTRYINSTFNNKC